MKVTFPRNTSRSYLRASSLLARTVEGEGKAENVRAIDLLRQLQHAVPPVPVELRSDICLTTVSGSVFSSESNTLYARLLEPVSPPPLSQVLEEIDFSIIPKS